VLFDRRLRVHVELGAEEVAMTITDMVLLTCVTGTVLLAAAVTAGAVVGWAARR
jgi:hypothetical protein